MKLNSKNREIIHFLRKSFLIMRITLFFVVLSATFSYSSNSYAQITKLSLRQNNATIKDVMKVIESQSEFIFFYEDQKIDLNRKVNINVEDSSINEILDQLLSGTDNVYIIRDRQITIGRSQQILNKNLTNGKELSESQQPQKKDISGIVRDSKGLSLPGVSVVVKGSNTGIITDTNGQFTLKVPLDAQILIFSFIGMKTQELVIGTKNVINVTMVEDKVVVDEVVVTALGIVKSKKSLTYATQELDMDGLTTVKDISLGNALAGKIAGVSITTSTGATGVAGDPQIIIRGDRSINNNNQPLIVVDGIPYSSSGGGLSSINPDDVQSMNVLKGPAASALYGSDAQNGAILVTTKKGKSGVPRIEVNSVSNFDVPYLYPQFQNEYGQGTGGLFNTLSYYLSWGPKMTGQTVTDWTGKSIQLTPQPNNVKALFQMGHNLTNNFSYSVGNDKSTAYFSYSNTMAQGLVGPNVMSRNNFNLRLTTELLRNLNMDFKITYFNQNLKDQHQVGDNTFSPMEQLMKMPRSIRTDDIKAGSYYDSTGSLRQLTWAPKSTDVINPYWALDGYSAPSTTNKINVFSKLRYDFTTWLYLQLRGGMTVTNSDNEVKTYWDTQYINSGTGEYDTGFGKNQALNADALLVFNKDLKKNLRLNINLGANITDSQSRSMNTTDSGLTAENMFSLSFAKSPVSTNSQSRIQKQSVYGMGQLSYHDYLFLEMTARNDWSSTLPKPFDYFYPSVGLTGIISEMTTLPDFISFAKVRGSYAEVGNDAGFAQIYQTYSSKATGPAGEIYPGSTRVPVNLIPEKTKSWEAGAELKFFKGRVGIDFTWYKSNTYNQLIQITTPPTSGFSSGWINCGDIQNTGGEFMIFATPVKSSGFEWNLDLNFTRNKNKVIQLSSTVNKYEISNPDLAEGQTWAIVGRPYGEVFTSGFLRNSTGKIIVNSLGAPEINTTNNPTPNLDLGNFNYDWRSGITNNFRYKNWNMSFLVDLNYGGVRQSATEAMMLMTGTSKASLVGRETGIVVDGVQENGTPNTVSIPAQTLASIEGGRISQGCGEPFNHDATNSRLRELAIGYSFPLKYNIVKMLKVSLVGRNLFYIYNGCKWFDPDNTYDSTTNGQGAESAFLPGARTLGLNIKLTL